MNIRTSIIALLAAVLIAVMPVKAGANSGELYVTDNNSIRIYAPDGTARVYASNLLRPRGLAFDGYGNLFVATLDTATLLDNRGQILKFAPDGTVTVFATGLDAPEGLAFDESGNLYVSSGHFRIGGSGRVTKITPNGTVSTFAVMNGSFNTNVHQSLGIAIDKENNVFVSDNQQNAIFMKTSGGQYNPPPAISTFASLSRPIGLAFDAVGNLYVSDAGPAVDPPLPGSITKIAPDGAQTLIVSGLGSLRGLAFDFDGNLFVAGYGDNVIYKITTNGSVSIFATGLNTPQYLAVKP
jgi:sugar lactone lactonase YvrE